MTVSFGDHVAVRGVSLDVPARQVTTLVGPSGCGKTTLLRAVNRLHDHVGGRVEGRIQLGDLDVYGAATRAELVRSRVGMVFQRPNPFPTMSIFDNVVSGLRFAGVRKKSLLQEAAEWPSATPRSGTSSSTGWASRRCASRAASSSGCASPGPWPSGLRCSSWTSPARRSTRSPRPRWSSSSPDLAREVTVVLVTHNMFQAARVSDNVAVLLMGDDRVGELVEAGPAAEVLHAPHDPRTIEYVSGRVG